MSELKFITEENRNQLRSALNLIDEVFRQTTYEYEEYFALSTSIKLLREAIEDKERNCQ
ncbi:hypothetical protein [Priestia megaterium]|uniref:hypothetical protein n=1 Tax=Priestia megaterium TaxID=1404 RepID=UPI0038797176